MARKLIRNQSGIAHLLLIVVLIVVFSAIGVVGYSIVSRNNVPGAEIQDVQASTGCTDTEPLPDECQDPDATIVTDETEGSEEL